MRNIEDIYEQNKKVNNGYMCCDLSNFRIFCNNIEKNIKNGKLAEATIEMDSLTHIYRDATTISYRQFVDRSNVYDIKAIAIPVNINRDFVKAKQEIEHFFIQNFCDGEFEITKERLFELPFWCVDWDWYNHQSRRFIDACKKANQIVGYKKDDEISSYYLKEEKAENNSVQEMFYSSYNGGRVRASFTKECDCLAWGFHHEAILEEDGLFWADTPAY